jgi:ABC-2 type transport system permease protein
MQAANGVLHGPAARMRTWLTILRISLEERLVYRVDFAVATLMRFLPIVTQIFLWAAIFEAVRGDTVAGMRFEDFVAYYLLVMIVRAFSSMPALASGIAMQVRNGEIKKFLIQPVDLIGFLLLTRIAHKLVYYLVASSVFALVLYFCRGYFPGWPAAPTLAFLLGFFLEATIGLISFWFLEVSSLLFIYMLLNFVLSGHMFPLDLLPAAWQVPFNILPFKYLAYFPAAVFLGKVQGPQLVYELSVQLAWVVFFMVICRVTYYFGVRRYSGYGG